MSRTRTTPCTSFPSFPRVSGDEPAVLQGIADFIGFPRVSGDEPARVFLDPEEVPFSPRERG